MDELIDLITEHSTKIARVNYQEISRKLDEVLYNVQLIIKLINSTYNDSTLEGLCFQILNRGFIVKENFRSNLHPNLWSIEIESNKYFITFKDSIDLLKEYFNKYKDEDNLINNMPKRLHPIYLFMKRRGLIYYDNEERRFKLV
jgi:hypothetical protein